MIMMGARGLVTWSGISPGGAQPEAMQRDIFICFIAMDVWIKGYDVWIKGVFKGYGVKPMLSLLYNIGYVACYDV